ncbi:MAG TPA: HNH endonuclease signature motif containing protein, partial [Acidimicrobiia bacterium]|nr:HNH endonuclease signature motif containing protein [Acidimicrobiia bacterium]
AMHHRHWINALGNVAYSGELPPELGIPFTTILDAETDRLWLKAHEEAKRHNTADQPTLAEATTKPGDDTGSGASAAGASNGAARASGSGAGGSGAGGSGAKVEVRRSALAALAFARMMQNGGGKGKVSRADMVIVCDLQAYRRGHAHDGEPCHIVGGGPIPVSLAKELGRDAFLKAVLHDGTEIHTIAHFGRRYPAVLRTALDLGAPPDFRGAVCAAPGCDSCYHLQKDHIDPVANGGLTSYLNNQMLCPSNHRIKTEEDRKANLLRRKKPQRRGPDPTRAGPSRDHSPPRLL